MESVDGEIITGNRGGQAMTWITWRKIKAHLLKLSVSPGHGEEINESTDEIQERGNQVPVLSIMSGTKDMDSSIHHEEGVAKVIDGDGSHHDDRVTQLMGGDRGVLTEDDVCIPNFHSNPSIHYAHADTRHDRTSASGGKPTKSS